MHTDAFYPLRFTVDIPDVFQSPFDVRPHAVAVEAAESLKSRLPELCGGAHDFDAADGGKMFGVLVVQSNAGETGYLSGYSGMLAGNWQSPGFVPPVFDQAARAGQLAEGECAIANLNAEIKLLEEDESYQDAIKRVEKHEFHSSNDIAALKQLHADRKLHRHQMRKNPGVTDAELDRLASQSRQDKLDYKLLRKKLHERGASSVGKLQEHVAELAALKKQRKKTSAELQAELFNGYRLRSQDGQTRIISEFYADGLPASGAGDCAATKLVQYAIRNQLLPVALAEFWWGAAPVGGLRKHARFYPSCRSRCRVILPFMLQGLSVSVPLHEQPPDFGSEYPQTLYEDDDIVVVEKPAGLLSVPGKVLTDSVESRLKARYPEVAGVMLLHRLDQATSGVMIAAKNPAAYKSLQHQFQDRTVEKRYAAVLDGALQYEQGEISLPLRIDYYDRPRQIVCHERGKSALTRYQVISRTDQTTRVAFYPYTGRTHQLRVHAAHPDGLNCPIVGDELYGRPAKRLHLHAEQLTFNHPVTDRRMTFSSDVNF